MILASPTVECRSVAVIAILTGRHSWDRAMGLRVACRAKVQRC